MLWSLQVRETVRASGETQIEAEQTFVPLSFLKLAERCSGLDETRTRVGGLERDGEGAVCVALFMSGVRLNSPTSLNRSPALTARRFLPSTWPARCVASELNPQGEQSRTCLTQFSTRSTDSPTLYPGASKRIPFPGIIDGNLRRKTPKIE